MQFTATVNGCKNDNVQATSMQYTVTFKGCKKDIFLLLFFSLLFLLKTYYIVGTLQWGGSNRYPNSVYKSKKWKILLLSIKSGIRWGTNQTDLLSQ